MSGIASRPWRRYTRKSLSKVNTCEPVCSSLILTRQAEIAVTNNGKPIALLTPVSDATLEETLASVRRARAIQAVKTMQADSVERGLAEMHEEEIEQEIQEVRKARRRRA